MKKLVCILICLQFLVSCSKKKDDVPEPCTNCNNPPPAASQNNFVSAKINGQSWQSTSLDSAGMYFNWLPGYRGFSLASNGSNQGIGVSTLDTAITNEKFDAITYSYPGQATRTAYFFYWKITSTDTISDCDQLSGWVKITSQDTAANKISGTFEYKVIDTHTGINDTIEVTQGVFTNVVYQVY